MKPEQKYLVVMLMLALGCGMKAQDTVKYDINDPRNPNCPCHKFQKLADEEYKKLLAKADKKEKDGGTSDAMMNRSNPANISDAQNRSVSPDNTQSLTNGNSAGVVDQHKKNRHHSRNHKKKKKQKRHPSWIQKLEAKARDICRELRDVNACYHWK